MSEFFRSDIVRDEMNEIFEIQKDLYRSIAHFTSMDDCDKRNHINKLKNLLDKQEILYVRLSLSDDPEAKEMKEKIILTSKAMGFSDIDMTIIFKNMKKTLDNLEKKLDTP
jgi:hypothetical protein